MHWIWSVAAVLTLFTVRTRMSRGGHEIYLSFDDGPDPVHTPPLLDLMKAYGVKATFFLIGDQVERHPELVQRIVDEGHAIGNHSMTHPRMPRLSARAQLADIAAADGVLRRFNGRPRQLFRPPNGRATLATIFNSLLRRRPLVLWSVDSKDYELDADQVVARLEQIRLRGGDILLFHDDGAVAVAALSRLLPQWLNSGLRFATL
ncbi:MAG: polysaccharide deacetylase family protein [Piscinibacter sp.]